MEQKLIIGSPEWFAAVRQFQSQLVNALDQTHQNLAKADAEIGFFADDRIKEQQKNLQRIFAADQMLVQKVLNLRGQELIDFWSKPPDTGLFRTRATKVLAQVRATAGMVEAQLQALNVKGFDTESFLRDVVARAEQILPSPVQIVTNLPWIVGGIALLALFPLISAFIKKQARQIEEQK